MTVDNLEATSCSGTPHGGVIFSPTTNRPNPFNNNAPGALVTISHDVSDSQQRVIGIDDNGVEHVARAGDGAKAGNVQVNIYHFDIPVEQIRSLAFQIRPYNHRAEFKNITLDPEHKTKVEVNSKIDEQ